jgi:ParB/RepB/Spo0J family partition protein
MMGKTTFEARRGTIFMIAPEDLIIIDDPGHPRYDPRAKLDVDMDLVASIDQMGILQPVSVTKGEDGRAWVVAGRRRVMAAREVNRHRNGIQVQVPCVVRVGEGVDLLAASIAENELRLNDQPLEKARKAARLMNQGYTEEQTALTFGVSVTALKNWLGLLSAPESIRSAIDSGQISASAATQIAKLPPEEREARLSEVSAASERRCGKTKAAKGAVKAVRMRNQREIEEELERKGLHGSYRRALEWVLRRD